MPKEGSSVLEVGLLAVHAEGTHTDWGPVNTDQTQNIVQQNYQQQQQKMLMCVILATWC